MRTSGATGWPDVATRLWWSGVEVEAGGEVIVIDALLHAGPWWPRSVSGLVTHRG